VSAVWPEAAHSSGCACTQSDTRVTNRSKVATWGTASAQHQLEDGLRELALSLSDWAQKEAIHPQWQVDEVGPGEQPQRSTDLLYRSGKKTLMVRAWHPLRRPTITAAGIMNVGACLVSGELNRLRVCIDDACRRYFYADDFRMTHCSEACRKRRDQARASARMQRYREKKRTNDAALERFFSPHFRSCTFERCAFWRNSRC
jgi:hypothetical protein